ncbi:hypothetical protein S40293_01616 [Stachybotrys chartarum IBT 40293]|nr:hypothetical protein S40293_01616 [Stachybotrys chartarum IBT 40293]
MRGEVQRKATLWRYASTSARVQDQQKDPIASSDKSMLSQSTDNEDGGSCGYNEPVYFPTSAKEMSPVFGAASAWFTPTMSQPPSLTTLDGAEYSRPCLDVPMVKLNPLDSVLTKLVCVDFDQLYFDRVYPFAPMVQRCRYSTWARNPNKTRPQACLQYAMWTLAASLSSQFQLVRRQLYLEARQILDALDIVSPDASLQSIEQAQAWVLLTIYELTCEDYRRGLVSAGRAFRLVQVMKLYQIDKQTSTSSQFEAVDLESMRRTFWLAYTLDRIVGAIDGLSMTFNEREIGTCLPAPDSHMMTNELPTAMSFLSDVLNGSGYEIFQDNPTGIDMSPFLESVVAATICGRVLDHKSRIPAEYEHGVLAVGAGICLHLGYFIHGEHHMYGVKYLQAFLATFLGATILQRFLYGVALASALAYSSQIIGCTLLGLYGSLIIYRLAWHPLRKFPGPIGARFSSLWFSGHVAGAVAHHRCLELYRKYGPFVRVGPSDLMIVHSQGVSAVHGAQSKCRKGPWYDADWPRQSIHLSRDHQFHHSRRRLWSQAFSEKALRGYESRVALYNKGLISRLREANGNPTDAAKWFSYYSFDVMGDLAFGKDFDMLKSGKQHWTVALLEEALSIQALKIPTWIFRMLVAIPGLSGKYWDFIHYCDEQLAAKIKDAKDTDNDFLTTLLSGVGPKPTGQDLLTLQSDTRTIIVAGSDTTAGTLAFIFYQLARHPAHVETLRNELKPMMNADGSFDHQKIQNLNHLNAIINETFRFNPVPPTAVSRKTPSEGITVDGTFIPGNVYVWTPQYVIGRSEDVYEKPDEFIPERWYSKTWMVKDKAGFAPFSIGPYACIGRPIALMQLRLVVADCVTNFDVEFAQGCDGSEFIDNVKDYFTWGMAELNLCFRSRSATEGN